MDGHFLELLKRSEEKIESTAVLTSKNLIEKFSGTMFLSFLLFSADTDVSKIIIS